MGIVSGDLGQDRGAGEGCPRERGGSLLPQVQGIPSGDIERALEANYRGKLGGWPLFVCLEVGCGKAETESAHGGNQAGAGGAVSQAVAVHM